MRSLLTIPDVTVRATLVVPPAAFELIYPPPPLGWTETVQQHLAEGLTIAVEDALAGLPVSPEVRIEPDGRDRVEIFWHDVEGTAEQVGDLAHAAAWVLQHRYEPAMRAAKRQADRTHGLR